MALSFLLFLSSVGLTAAYHSACPTWSSWSDYSRCHNSHSAVCDTMILNPTPKLYRIAEKHLKDRIEKRISQFKWQGKGLEEGVTWEIVNYKLDVGKVEGSVGYHQPGTNHVKLLAKNIHIAVEFDIKAKSAEEDKFSVRATYKYEEINHRFYVGEKNGIFNLSPFMCHLDKMGVTVNVPSDMFDVLKTLFQKGGSKDRELRIQFQNIICDEMVRVVNDFQSKHFKGSYEVKAGHGLTLHYPFNRIVWNDNYNHVGFASWVQRGKALENPGFNQLDSGFWRQVSQKIRFGYMNHEENVRICRDNSYAAHIAFSEYLFNDYFHEAFDDHLVKHSVTKIGEPALLDQLQLTCEAECIGKVLKFLAEEYPGAMLGLQYSVRHAPFIHFNDGWLKVYSNHGVLRLSVNDNSTFEPLVWLGSFNVKAKYWTEPYVENNQIHAQFNTSFSSIELENQNTVHVPSNKATIETFTKLAAEFLVEPLNQAFKPGFPLPKFAAVKYVNTSITALEQNLLQVSVDLE